jgi:NADPH-dependent 2,4-dienoyl-CoA reductase/sulfur reductase-like enzyme
MDTSHTKDPILTLHSGTHIVIIGNGISGITCARNIRKRSGCKISVVSDETDHFFSRTALMYIYMGHMKYEHTKPYEDSFWKKNRIELIKNRVAKINTQKTEIHFGDGTLLHYDILVIASGSHSTKFGWPGQDLDGVQGLYSYPDLLKMEKFSQGVKQAVVVGGGLIGIEMAEMLRSRSIQVTMLVRDKHYWDSVLPQEEALMIEQEMKEHHISLLLETELKEIRGDASGKVCSILTTKGEEIPCGFLGLTIGVSPNTGFLHESGIEVGKGVLVDHYFRTNIPNIYAIGDCAQFRLPLPGRKAIEQVWYTGKMQGEAVAGVICGIQEPYKPGFWFNSAKFFNLEYQTYGTVNPKMGEFVGTFFWQHASAKISFRANYDSTNGLFLGTNVFGMRMRHEIFDKWLRGGKTIDYVIEHLAEACFDPEFYSRHELAIQKAFQLKKNSSAIIQESIRN